MDNRFQDDYELIKQVGRGKYSQVYEGVNIVTNKRAIIKLLKPGMYVKRKEKSLINTDITIKKKIS